MRAAWRRWTAAEPARERWSGAWWRHQAVVFGVFGITGSSAMWIVRPQLYSVMGVDAVTGPTSSQRMLSLLYMMPFYYAILLVVGTACGKHAYVKNMALRPLRLFTRSRTTAKID